MADTYVALPDGTYVQIPSNATADQIAQMKTRLAALAAPQVPISMPAAPMVEPPELVRARAMAQAGKMTDPTATIKADVKAGDYAGAAHKLLTREGEAFAPLAIPGAVVAPAAAIGGAAVGALAGIGGRTIAQLSGVTPSHADLIGDVAGIGGGALGAGAGAGIDSLASRGGLLRGIAHDVADKYIGGRLADAILTEPKTPTVGDTLMARGTPTGIPEDASPNIGRPSFTMRTDKNGVRWATAPDDVKVSVSGPMSRSEVEGLLDNQRQAQAAIKSRYAIGSTPTSSTGGPVQIGIGKTPQLQPELGSPENPGFHAKLPTRMPKTPTPARIEAPPVQWRTETPSVASPPVKWGTAAPEPAKVNPPPVRWSQGGGPKSIGSVVSGGGGNAGEIGASPVEREIQTIMQKPIVTPEEQGRVEQILGPNSRMRQGEGVSDWQARVTGMFKAARGRTQ